MSRPVALALGQRHEFRVEEGAHGEGLGLLVEFIGAPPVDVTIRELAQLVGEVVGYAGDTVFDTRQPDGAPRKLLNVDRLHACGWSASISLREGLAATCADFCAMAAEEQAGA